MSWLEWLDTATKKILFRPDRKAVRRTWGSMSHAPASQAREIRSSGSRTWFKGTRQSRLSCRT